MNTFCGTEMHQLLVRLTYVALLFSRMVARVGMTTKGGPWAGVVFDDDDLQIVLATGQDRNIQVCPAQQFDSKVSDGATALVRGSRWDNRGDDCLVFTQDTLLHMTFDSDFVRLRCKELAGHYRVSPFRDSELDFAGIGRLLDVVGDAEISCMQLLRAAGYGQQVVEVAEFEWAPPAAPAPKPVLPVWTYSATVH